MTLEKLRKQIFTYRRMGYPLSHMEARVTPGHFKTVIRELQKEYPRLQDFNRILGVELVQIPGPVETAYVIVPYMGVDLYREPNSTGLYIWIMDADRRLLDLDEILVRDVLFGYQVLDVEPLENDRVHIKGLVKSTERISV